METDSLQFMQYFKDDEPRLYCTKIVHFPSKRFKTVGLSAAGEFFLDSNTPMVTLHGPFISQYAAWVFGNDYFSAHYMDIEDWHVVRVDTSAIIPEGDIRGPK